MPYMDPMGFGVHMDKLCSDLLVVRNKKWCFILDWVNPPSNGHLFSGIWKFGEKKGKLLLMVQKSG